MQTFKLIMKLLKSHLGSLMIVFGAFMTIAVIMSNLNSGENEDDFQPTRLRIGLVDEGDGTIASFIEEYYKDEHEIKELVYDEKTIVNELYWKSLDYILMIPAGEDVKLYEKDGDIRLNCMKVPDHSANGLFETEVLMSLNKLQALLTNGYSLEDAEGKLFVFRDDRAEVIMAQEVNENSHDRMATFLLYAPYLFIAICVEGIGFVLLIVNGKLVKNRTECSSTPMKNRLSGIVGGILCFGAAVYAVVFAVAAVMSEGSIFADIRMPFFMLNAFVLLLFSVSLGFLTGMIAKSTTSINGYQNVFALALCFMGGVFVPQEVLGEAALKVGRLTPTYWYVKNMDLISTMVEWTSALTREVLKNCTVMLCFAVAVFSLALVLMSARRKNALN